MAMGPFAMFDLSGLDVVLAHPTRRSGAAAAPHQRRSSGSSSMRRLGQKTGAGFYRYEKGSAKAASRFPIRRSRRSSPRKRARPASRRATSTDDEIASGSSARSINAAQNLLEDGIALRPGDIDIVYVYGYGFPPHHGGPMWYADESACERLRRIKRSDGASPLAELRKRR